MPSSTYMKRTVARRSITTVAVAVNPFLLLESLSLFLFDFVIVLTIAIFEFWTAAQPILKSIGKVIYQTAWSVGFLSYPAISLLVSRGYRSFIPGG